MSQSRVRAAALRWSVFVAVVAGGVLVSRGLGKVNSLMATKPAYDLVVDWQAARAFVDGFSPYSTEGVARAHLTKTGLGHPPSTIFWALPFAAFDLPIARQALFEISLILVVIQMGVVFSELSFPRPWVSAWFGLGLILSCDWFHYLAFLGQWSQVIGFFYFLAWYSLRRRWHVFAGMAVGAACTIKMYPGVMFGFLILGRRWRSCAAAIMTYLIVSAFMTMRFGLSSWVYFFREQRGTANAWMSSIQNQSIHGIVLRLFRPVCETQRSLHPAAAAISGVLALMLLAWAAWLGRRFVRDKPMDLTFCLAAVLSVLTSNWSWEHYNVLFILPITVAIHCLRHVGMWKARPLLMAVPAVLLLSALLALPIPIMVKAQAQADYFAQPGAWRHFWVHTAEWLNLVPVLALTGALFILLWLSQQPPGSKDGPFSFDGPNDAVRALAPSGNPRGQVVADAAVDA